jgi:hypothetical protein
MAVTRFVHGGESDSQSGNTALMWAADRGHADCARLLIDAGADKEAKDDVRRRPLLCWGTLSISVFFISIVFQGLPRASLRQLHSIIQFYQDLSFLILSLSSFIFIFSSFYLNVSLFTLATLPYFFCLSVSASYPFKNCPKFPSCCLSLSRFVRSLSDFLTYT